MRVAMIVVRIFSFRMVSGGSDGLVLASRYNGSQRFRGSRRSKGLASTGSGEKCEKEERGEMQKLTALRTVERVSARSSNLEARSSKD